MAGEGELMAGEAKSLWLIAYSPGKDDPVLFSEHAIGHKPYALFFGRDTNDGEQGEDRLPGDGMACGLDGSENLLPAIGIEFVPVKTEEEAFADSFRGGLWVLFPNGGFNKGTRRLAHRAPHREPFFSGPLHEHVPIAGVHFGRRILH
jgi:hypothetical protein